MPSRLDPPILVFDSREYWYPVGVEESLRPFGYSWEHDGWVRNGKAVERLDFPADMRQPDLPMVGYRRAQRIGHQTWHQFWLWSLYNPKEYAGFGKHEGDWEFVQIAVDENGKPWLATCSQHQSGGKREWWATERDDGRLIIYVARDSHANYFDPVRNMEDTADGKGLRAHTIEWRPFGQWATWEGRWGNSTQQGRSPSSPGRQGHRWHRPHLFHSQAR